VQRSLDVLEELSDVVEGQPGRQCPEVARVHRKRPTAPVRTRYGKTAPEDLVDRVLERAAHPALLCRQFRGHVVVQGYRGSQAS